ncbi:hypothetical protein DFH94DRAFT_755919 [Russula ochroleuca]|uniref:Uncharacterized protein n=1 Tax=Russula ochroleuca TaxID=152965 RepID=A0A9P5MSR6_9AGAM|nr:hypothetical protein DFH94DRAFT_755919 [Russula ochroleuca]
MSTLMCPLAPSRFLITPVHHPSSDTAYAVGSVLSHAHDLSRIRLLEHARTAGIPTARMAEQTLISSRRSSVVALDQPTRMSSAAKSRAAPHLNVRELCLSRPWQRSCTNPHSPKDLPSGDNARGNEHELGRHGDNQLSRRGIPPVLLTARVLHLSSPRTRWMASDAA